MCNSCKWQNRVSIKVFVGSLRSISACDLRPLYCRVEGPGFTGQLIPTCGMGIAPNCGVLTSWDPQVKAGSKTNMLIHDLFDLGHRFLESIHADPWLVGSHGIAIYFLRTYFLGCISLVAFRFHDFEINLGQCNEGHRASGIMTCRKVPSLQSPSP